MACFILATECLSAEHCSNRIHVTQRVPLSSVRNPQNQILDRVESSELGVSILERIAQTQVPTTAVSENAAQRLDETTGDPPLAYSHGNRFPVYMSVRDF